MRVSTGAHGYPILLPTDWRATCNPTCFSGPSTGPWTATPAHGPPTAAPRPPRGWPTGARGLSDPELLDALSAAYRSNNTARQPGEPRVVLHPRFGKSSKPVPALWVDWDKTAPDLLDTGDYAPPALAGRELVQTVRYLMTLDRPPALPSRDGAGGGR